MPIELDHHHHWSSLFGTIGIGILYLLVMGKPQFFGLRAVSCMAKFPSRKRAASDYII